MGEITENIEFQNAIEPKGNLKIELFGENGEVEKTLEKNNYVSPIMLEAMHEMNARAMFSTNYDTFANGETPTGYALTSASHAIDEREDNFILGKIIGVGTKSGLSSIALRGSYNSIESVVNRDYRKYVFDFTTAQGNGTFQSIYSFQDYDSSQSYLTTFFRGGKRILTPSNSGDAYFALGSYFFMRSGKSIMRLSYSDFIGGINFTWAGEDDLRNAPYELFDMPNSYCMICTDGKHIYMYNPSTRTLSRSLPETPNTFTSVKVYTSTEIVETSFYYFTYSRASKVFVLQAGSATKSYLIGDNFEIKSVIPKSLGYAIPFAKLSTSSDSVYDLETGDFLYRVRAGDSTTMSGIFEISDRFLAVQKQSGSRLEFYPRSNFFSRILLDAPVTKTSAQTMKITYEFNLPVFNYGKPYAKP